MCSVLFQILLESEDKTKGSFFKGITVVLRRKLIRNVTSQKIKMPTNKNALLGNRQVLIHRRNFKVI